MSTPGFFDGSHGHTPTATTKSGTTFDQQLSLGLGYPSGMASTMVCNRVVRFDSECILIPEHHKSKRPLMITKSYSIPLWKKRSTSGESNPEDVGEPSSSSPPAGGVVLKLPVPSFMAKPSRSPSRTRECPRPPCLVNGAPSYFHQHHQPRPSNPNVLPNAIQVVDTHHTHITLPPSSPSPTRTTFSEAALSGESDSKSPLRLSPSIQFKAPSSPSELGPPSPSSATVTASYRKGKSKERERESQKIATIPLRACCPDCFSITEESLGDQWKERFSRGARRRRGSSVSSATSASESEGGEDADPYSPMASYKPLREAVREEATGREKQQQEEKDKANSHFNSNTPVATSTSAIADEDDGEDILVTPLSLAVRVDEVDSLKGSRFTRPPTPLTDHFDTEDEGQPQKLQEPPMRGRGMEREISTSSVGSSSSTFSAMSGCSSSTSHMGGSTTSLNESASTDDQSTLSSLPTSLRRSNTQPLPSSSSSAPPTSYTMATRGKRRRKPSTPIKEDDEPPEEKYVGFCRDRVRDRGDKERGRSKRDAHRLKALKIRAYDAEDDDDMLFPLPSPRRSPSISPLNTPNGSLTPTNASIGGSKTPSPTASVGTSPSASSSTVHLQPNAPKKRSRLGFDSSREGPTDNASIEGVEPDAAKPALYEADEGSTEAGEEESLLSQSITRKDKEKVLAPALPSIAKAAEIALAETSVTPPSPAASPVEEEWVHLRPRGSGHSKTASEPAIGSLKDKDRPKKLSPRIPFLLPTSVSTSSQQQRTQTSSSSSPMRLDTSTRTAPSSSTPSPVSKTRRKTSLRSGAGAFFDIFRGVPGITP